MTTLHSYKLYTLGFNIYLTDRVAKSFMLGIKSVKETSA